MIIIYRKTEKSLDIYVHLWYNISEVLYMSYYDGTKLLSMCDINGNEPELYLCTTNRTGGKTTYFNRYLVKRFLRFQEKFIILYRYNYELAECATKFFKDIKSLFFNDFDMTQKTRAHGIYAELLLNGVTCGYALSLNNAEAIKKHSHIFNDVKRILFDEFQSETNNYCANEISKFQSIHTSIARGQGEQVRRVPVYLIGNAVSILNPYYTALGISNTLNSRTKFLKGDGWVLEQGYIDSAAQALKDSAFNRAFKASDYVAYASQNIYLNDNHSFVEKMSGKSTYFATLKYKNKHYAVRTYKELGIVYIDDRPDMAFKLKVAITTDDHNINYVMLQHYSYIIELLRSYFNKGCFRFKNLDCKDALLSAISYK